MIRRWVCCTGAPNWHDATNVMTCLTNSPWVVSARMRPSRRMELTGFTDDGNGLFIARQLIRQRVLDALKAMTTPYGYERMVTLSKQTPDPSRYLTFYGTPAKGKSFAWRVAQHHLTMVYAEFDTGNPGEFGPILLGGNPVGNMWDAEDSIFLEMYASLSRDEQKTASAKGKGGKGIRVGDLNAKAKGLAEKLFAKRLEVFAPDYRKNFDLQLKRDGGLENLYLTATAKDASKSHHKGGNYYWRLAGEHVFCDWAIQGNEHLHLTLRASPVKKAG